MSAAEAAAIGALYDFLVSVVLCLGLIAVLCAAIAGVAGNIFDKSRD